MFRSTFVIAVCLVLGGCVHTVWQKPGTTRSDYEQIKATCLMEGFERVPQDNRVVLVSPGQEYTSERCAGHGCSEVTRYVPPEYGLQDSNSDLREQIVRACFYRNGWEEVQVEY